VSHIAIIIPARFASTRFPGKPLALLNGKAMLTHVYENAMRAAKGLDHVTVAVATDDPHIEDHCKANNLHYLMTSPDCHTGSDRVIEAAGQLINKPSFVINMQGDAPFTPPDFIRAMIDEHLQVKDADIITPVTQMTWAQLDKLREDKKTTPFSGTTAVLDKDHNALWFSKNIIPAIRKENRAEALSPVYRHIGLYGYRWEALQTYKTLPPSPYEELEGLEQLRALENGLKIRAVIVDYKGRPSMSGIDSPEDLRRAEKLLRDAGANA
jgi:3-deoxy-manno-octulosonate cytidylyltransferase (CMP-KDO synthetase)